MNAATELELQAIECPNQVDLPGAMEQVVAAVAADGFAVVQPWDDQSSTFRSIAQCLGIVQSHARADEHGITGEGAPVNVEWKAFEGEYLGVASGDFLPHTDGSFLNGLVHQDGAFRRLEPPKMVLLQCMRKAEAGGENFLVDGQVVFDALARRHRNYLDTLMTPGCVVYCRDDLIALDCAVYERLPDGAIRIRYRYDSVSYVSDRASDAFHCLHHEFHMNSAYQRPLDLAEGQILLIDNYRMLHGRKSFAHAQGPSKRRMRRVWLAPDAVCRYSNPDRDARARRALKPFESYRLFEAS